MQEKIDFLLAQISSTPPELRPDGYWVETTHIDVIGMAGRMAAMEAVLSTVTAIARPDGETDLIYHYHIGSGRDSTALNIKTRTRNNTIESITPACPAANWIEREIHDLYAVEFSGHPNLERLIRPPELPNGFFRQPGGAQSKKLEDGR